MGTGLIVLLGVTLLIVFYFISIYNNLVRLRNQSKNAFSQIDVQLTRRYELIPNLVETAKKFMSHEKETLQAVIEARNQAQKISLDLHDKPMDPKMMEGLLLAEKQLGNKMGQFFALAEQYPDLKSDQTMTRLMEELTSTENKVSFARQGYNDIVTDYNNALEVFPQNVVAKNFSFAPSQLFEVEEAQVRKAVKVQF